MESASAEEPAAGRKADRRSAGPAARRERRCGTGANLSAGIRPAGRRPSPPQAEAPPSRPGRGDGPSAPSSRKTGSTEGLSAPAPQEATAAPGAFGTRRKKQTAPTPTARSWFGQTRASASEGLQWRLRRWRSFRKCASFPARNVATPWKWLHPWCSICPAGSAVLPSSLRRQAPPEAAFPDRCSR